MRALRKRYGRAGKKYPLNPYEKAQLKIARDTLKMPDAMAGVMGGMTKSQARFTILILTGKEPKESKRGHARSKRVAAPHPERCECGTTTGRHADSCPAMFGACGDCEVCGSLNPGTCGHYDEDGNLIDEEA